jgi:hypothetical protein
VTLALLFHLRSHVLRTNEITLNISSEEYVY